MMYTQKDGKQLFDEDRARMMADPEMYRIYEEEAKKKAVWLQLVEARQDARLTQEEVAKRMGISQAQVARIEKRGYDAYTLKTIRRYIAALGKGFMLQVTVRKKSNDQHPIHAATI